MKKKARKTYSLDQSPLYKLRTVDALSKVLNCSQNTLERIVKRGELNYYFTHLAEGERRRELHVPKSQLKRIHIRLNSLLSRITPPDYLNSGIKGRSNIKNASDHASDTALVKMDIKSFYLSTSEEMVFRAFRKVFCCTRDVSELLASLCCVHGHLPTGSPISQSMAFYTNIGAFNHIQGYAKSRAIRFSLYVDDLTFSGKKIPRNFLTYVENYLKRNRGYTCHKFRTYRAITPKVVTGAVIDNGVLKVKNSHRKTINEFLSDYDRVCNEVPPESDEAREYFQKLVGHLFSAGQINGRYYQKGKDIVTDRASLGIKAVNQNSL